MIFKMSFDESIQKIDVDFGEIKTITTSENIDYYEGEYETTPSINEQVLRTKQKYLTKDITVKKIPYAEVSNIANGKTVTIG